MLFTAVSRPSSQWFCLVQPPKHSCLKSVPKHEWKRSSHTQSVSVFRRGVTALSSQILFLCFLGFCFPSEHDTFSVHIGHLFPIFGAELNGTFLVTPVYLHRGASFLSLGRSLNGTFLVTPVYLHRGALVLLWGYSHSWKEESNTQGTREGRPGYPTSSAIARRPTVSVDVIPVSKHGAWRPQKP